MTSDAMQAQLAREVLGNTVQAYLTAAAVFIGVLLVLWIVKITVITRLHKLAKKTATDVDDFVIGLLRHIGPFVYSVIALALGLQFLVISEGLQRVFQIIFVVILTVKAVQILQDIVTYVLKKWVAREEDATSAVAVKNMGQVVRVLLWLGGLVFILDNLGINVTAVVAGLGVGGIAVALAAQAVLGDAFSSFAIFMDKPFRVGDFIIVGDLLGTVEYVGFKTTRIRSLGGEQLIFSNSDLTNSRIRNYKRMEMRRVVFKLGVIYQTTLEQIKAIPGIIESIIKEHELAKFDRAHFQSYGDFALIFEVVFYVLSPDYNKYMDVQQYINVRIMEDFKKREIEFAYPTQQLYVTKVDPPAPS